jgi:serine protease Do
LAIIGRFFLISVNWMILALPLLRRVGKFVGVLMKKALMLAPAQRRLMALAGVWLLVGLGGEGVARELLRADPGDVGDLLAVQGEVQRHLRSARMATVALDLADGMGSGVVGSPTGLVLTAGHVSGVPGKILEVIFHDGSRAQGKTLGYWKDGDAGMVQLEGYGPWPSVAVRPGGEDVASLGAAGAAGGEGELLPGQWCFALGHPGGYDGARGSVLRVGRVIRVGEDTIQTDCTLMSGDSGGPLFDLNGELVGIHSRIQLSPSQNFHVAVPSFRKHWVALTSGQRVGRGGGLVRAGRGGGRDEVAGSAGGDGGELAGEGSKAGAEGGPAGSAGGQAGLGMSGGWVDRGDGYVRVESVEPGGPAERAGLERGDMIMGVGGDRLVDEGALGRALSRRVPGDVLRLSIWRVGQLEEIELDITLGEPGP